MLIFQFPVDSAYTVCCHVVLTLLHVGGKLDRFVVLLGGLHIEMALWSTLGDLMLGSGWPKSLKDAGIVNSLAAGMCPLKAVNVMRKRYAHQDTTAGLDILRKKAFNDSGTSLSLEEWISVLSEQYPTFKFWSLVLEFQRGTFLFIRANRERKINLMIRFLNSLTPEERSQRRLFFEQCRRSTHSDP